MWRALLVYSLSNQTIKLWETVSPKRILPDDDETSLFQSHIRFITNINNTHTISCLTSSLQTTEQYEKSHSRGVFEVLFVFLLLWLLQSLNRTSKVQGNLVLLDILGWSESEHELHYLDTRPCYYVWYEWQNKSHVSCELHRILSTTERSGKWSFHSWCLS